MLFFWEEEAVRWRLLDEEESEIRKAMEEGGSAQGGEGVESMKAELRVALESVRMRRRMRPSERVGQGGGLPEYQARG